MSTLKSNHNSSSEESLLNLGHNTKLVQDLKNKISEILSDYDNPKYKKMVDSAYNKTMELCDLDVIYEKYLVPLAAKGKSEHVER